MKSNPSLIWKNPICASPCAMPDPFESIALDQKLLHVGYVSLIRAICVSTQLQLFAGMSGVPIIGLFGIGWAFRFFFVRKTINSFIITVGVCRSNGIDKERELRYFFAPMLGRNSFIITDFFHLRFVEFTKQQWMNQKIKMVPVISAFIFLSCCRK